MKNNSPQKHAFISCLILVTGILLVVIGAMTTKEYKINLCLLIGAIVVIGGIVYHLIMMKSIKCQIWFGCVNHATAWFTTVQYRLNLMQRR